MIGLTALGGSITNDVFFTIAAMTRDLWIETGIDTTITSDDESNYSGNWFFNNSGPGQ